MGSVPSHRPDLGPCHIHTNADNGNGYVQFRYDHGNGKYAHRYAWERVHGRIPTDLQVDHLCRVRSCVNIGHLELVTSAENTRRASRAMTTCGRGHPRTPENIYKWPGGSPHRNYCRQCHRENDRRYAEERRGGPPPPPKYTDEFRRQIAARVLDGEKYRIVSHDTGVPISTIEKWVQRLRV